MPRKKKTLGKLKSDLQKLVNKYCKLRDCDEDGGNCISCGKWYPLKKLDGGHFIPSTYSAVRFNEDNINAQCSFHCNRNKRGNPHEYRPNLIDKIGIERVEWLEEHRNDPVKWSMPDLREQIQVYKNRLKELQS
ncbi:MAG: recombination protein NinG [Candidatus Bathyarchaeota archaeon]